MLAKLGAVVFLWILLGMCAHAGTLHLDADTKNLNIAPATDYFCTDQHLSPEQLESQARQPLGKERIAFGITHQSCWFRLELENRGQAGLYYLSLESAILDHIWVTLQTEQGQWQQIQLGDNQPYEQRPIDAPGYVIPLTLATGDHRLIWIGVKTTSSMSVIASISASDRYVEYLHDWQWLRGVFYGMTLGLIAYNLLLSLILREVNHLVYVLHVVFVTCFFAARDGYTFRWWPHAIEWNSDFIFFAAFFAFMTAIQFARNYLLTPEQPHLDHPMRIAIGSCLGMTAMYLILPDQLQILTVPILGVLVVATVLPVGIYRLRQGFQPAYYFVISWALFLIMILVSLIAVLGVGAHIHYAILGLKLAFAWQQILISLGMGARINSLKEQQMLAQQTAFEAQAQNQAKSDFLARMSHEIRTPMNGVLGVAQLLKDTELSTTQKHYVDTIHQSGGALLRVINDILDYSKVEAGKMTVEHIPFSLNTVMHECASIFEPACQEKRLQLNLELVDVPDLLLGDPIRLRQILINLIGNAIKFTDQGTITIKTRIAASDDLQLILEFAVQDTGIGMTQEQQHRIFSPFTQADNSTSRRYGGTGLGLAICKQLVELMGGEIHVDSLHGQGTTIGFSLPLSRIHNPLPNTDPKHAEETDPLPLNLHVLVADDNAVNRLVIAGMLKKLGVAYDMANNGAEALELFVTQPNRYSLIFMDCEMPETDGYWCTREIRQIETAEARKPTPIIALTAHVLSEDQNRCYIAGMNGYLSKPLSADQLKKTLLYWSTPST